MMEPAPSWVQGIVTLLVTSGVFVSGVLIARLLLSYLLARMKVPTLLWRDAYFFLGVMGVIAGGYVWLWAGFTAPMRPWWWTVLAGVVFVSAAWIFAVHEVRRIITTHNDKTALFQKETKDTLAELGDKADAAYHEANEANTKISNLNQRLLDEVEERKHHPDA